MAAFMLDNVRGNSFTTISEAGIYSKLILGVHGFQPKEMIGPFLYQKPIYEFNLYMSICEICHCASYYNESCAREELGTS